MRLFLVKLTEALQRLNRGLIGMIHAYRYIIGPIVLGLLQLPGEISQMHQVIE
jgi:hypothetical protein